MTWYFPRYAVLIPKMVQDWMYPIDKNNMDLLRFLHFMRAGDRDRAVHSDRLAGTEVALAQADDFVRTALARDLLSRHLRCPSSVTS